MTSATIWSMGSVRCDFFKNFVLRTRSSGRTTVCNRQSIYVCVFSFSIALQGLLIHLAAFTRACVTEIELQPVKRSKRGAAAIRSITFAHYYQMFDRGVWSTCGRFTGYNETERRRPFVRCPDIQNSSESSIFRQILNRRSFWIYWGIVCRVKVVRHLVLHERFRVQMK